VLGLRDSRIQMHAPPTKSQAKRLLILLGAPPSPFIQTDIDLLSRRFPVEVLIYQNKRLQMAGEVFRRIIRGGVGGVLFWFAIPSYGFGISLIARILRCPVILVTGGFDVANMPEIGFGSMIRPKLRLLVIGMLRMANTILAFSNYSRQEVLRYVHPQRLVTLYPGVDTDKFRPAAEIEKERLVVTVAASVGQAFIRQKGLDTFVRAAQYVPDARFVLIGRFVDEAATHLRAEAPANVEFTEQAVSDAELLAYYQRARVYVQASLHEGFGVAVAEAMAAECVPVVADTTAMPEVVGDTGFYAPPGDAVAFGAAIEQALADDGSRARAARRRIIENFTVAHRERRLVPEVGRFLRPRRARRAPQIGAQAETNSPTHPRE
jgi:glycosyltransferase involved in cell wall biosynthesis